MSDAQKKRIPGPWLIGAGCVVIDGGKALLVRARYGSSRGRYLLPAGKVEVGEMPDRAAARETLEETGLEVAITGLLGVRIWAMENGQHNYFFMFQSRLLTPASQLRPDPQEIEDARFFTRQELDALGPDETWAGAIAIVHKALDEPVNNWPDYAGLSSDSGVASSEGWRFWM